MPSLRVTVMGNSSARAMGEATLAVGEPGSTAVAARPADGGAARDASRSVAGPQATRRLATSRRIRKGKRLLHHRRRVMKLPPCFRKLVERQRKPPGLRLRGSVMRGSRNNNSRLSSGREWGSRNRVRPRLSSKAYDIRQGLATWLIRDAADSQLRDSAGLSPDFAFTPGGAPLPSHIG